MERGSIGNVLALIVVVVVVVVVAVILMAALPTTYAKRHGSVAEIYRVLDCGGFSKSRRWQILPCRPFLIGEGDGMHARGLS